jgi:uncharacterized protein YegL
LRRAILVLVALCAGGLSVFAQGAAAATASLAPAFSATNVATCNGSTTATVTLAAQDPPATRRPLDVMFILDESGSIAASDFSQVKSSVQQWALGQVFGPAAVQASVAMFSGSARLPIPLTAIKQSFLNGVGAISQYGGSTNITSGLQAAQQEWLAHGRATAQPIFILETDGFANVAVNQLPGAVAAIKSSGGLIFAIGVGPDVDRSQLSFIASTLPGLQTVYPLADYAGLTNTLNTISSILNPAAQNVAYSVTPAAGWEIAAASATRGTVTMSASSLSWSAAELRTGQTTITYTLHHTGATGGTVAPQATAALTWKDDAGVQQSASYAAETVQVAGCNAPPVARAGNSRTVELNGARTANVTLDGTGSTDDGMIHALDYTWREGTTTLGTGSKLTTPLGLGVHDITLTVDDGQYTATDHVTITVVDPTPPVVTPVVAGTAGTSGWYTSDVAVSWTVTDLESAVTSTSCGPSAVAADTAGVSFSCSATSAGGTTTVATPAIKRDATKPTVTYAGNAGTYALVDTVAISCTPADNLSGVVSSTCAAIAGPAYSFGGGAHPFSASATDGAGNVGTGSTSFTVTVTAEGLCLLMKQFVASSANYQALPPRQQAAVDRHTGAVCRAAGLIVPKLNAPQKALLVSVYKGAVNGLVKSGWLTPQQAATLASLAASI